MAAPVLYFEHALDHLKGWPSPSAIDAVAKKSANVTLDPVYGGRVAHRNASNEFELGAKNHQMPIFLIQGSDSFDVSNPGGNNWFAIAPAGHMSGLVATGAYELETTEYDQTTGVTYAANDLLHSPTEDQITGTDKTAAGKLFKRKGWPGGSNAALVLYTDSICAIVSTGTRVNEHRQHVLAFYPFLICGTEA